MYQHISIQTYTTALQTGQTTCEAVVLFYLQQIEKTKHLNAFVNVYADEALQQAKALDAKRKAGEPLGALHGVVIALKDVICYKDHPVSAASSILHNFNSIYNSTTVQRLLDAEAIIIGNCNCDEFAMGSTNENSAHGKVLNAADETRVPGGSSGGSAVAVQAKCCMVSLGSDTGGSVRQPADFCGLVGLKPTYGRISRYGLIAYASSFDQIGIFANNVNDVATVLQTIAGPDEFDSTVSHQNPVEDYLTPSNENTKLKIAYPKQALETAGLDAEIKDNIFQFIEKLKADGHTVEPFDFDLIDYIVPTYYVLTTAEASSNLSRYDGVKFGHRTNEPVEDLTDFYKKSRSEGFGKEVQRRIMLGSFVLSAGYFDAYFTKAQQVRRLLINKTNEVFTNFDFILMPVCPTTAFKHGEKNDDPIAMYMSDIYTVFANLVGVPAIALPLFKHSNGMPYGLQLHANLFQEKFLLDASRQLI